MQKMSTLTGYHRVVIAFLIVIVAFFAGFGENDSWGASAQQANIVAVEPTCRPGTGWVWTTGPNQPEAARQAELALSNEGISAAVTAFGFGEKDSCGNFALYATDFRLTLQNTSRLSPSEQQALSLKILPILARFETRQLGNIQITFGPDNTKFYRGSRDPEEAVLSAKADASVSALPNKKVYLLVYNPTLSNGQDFNTYMGWTPYSSLVQSIISSFQTASHGQVQYTVVDTHVVTDQWPIKIDGFRYTEEQYISDYRNGTPHEPGDVDYDAIVGDSQFDICGRLNRGEIDELWIYAGPYDGFYESRLVGPNGYWFNSPPMQQTHGCSELLPIMGLNFERGVPEAMESFGHRAESTMSKTYGSWEENRTAHNWDRFALVKAQSPDYTYSGCGSIHYPANGVTDYDWSNTGTALTNCEDFKNYPNLGDPSVVAQPITCTAWNCDGYDYLMYWYSHLPSVSGCTAAISNNWWEYITDPDLALTPSISCPPPPCPTITDWKAEYWTNDSLLGPPAICRNDLEIYFGWGNGSPDPIISGDHFSARWTRSVSFDAGLYRFHIDHDDGARIYIDNVLAGDFWSTCCTWDTVDKELEAGNHEIRLEMHEIDGSANVQLWWEPVYSLSIDRNGTGSGTVTSDPTGIDCGADCWEAYTAGTPVALTAMPISGHTFAGWSGDADCSDGRVLMDASKTCIATFNLPPPATNGLYLSLTGGQTIGGVTAADEDILKFDGTNWSLYFDGSDVGVASPDLFAFSIVDADTILMSFSAAVTLNGIAVAPQDIVKFDATSLGSATSGTWSLYFDGSDVQLSTTEEKIDAVGVLPDGRVLISTTGNPAVTGLTGLADEDIIALTPATLGSTTSGTWSWYFDGSDVGLSTTSGEDIDALDVSGGRIYLSTLDAFAVTGVSGADEDVFVCDPTSLGSNTACNYSSSLYFDGSNFGLAANDVDAIHLLSTGSGPTATLTVTTTGTGGGLVTSDPPGIACGSTCSYTFPAGAYITLTAAAVADSSFTGWSDEMCSGTSSTCGFTITGNTSVNAEFTLVPAELPDLVIESIRPVPANPPRFQPVIFSVVIKNQGTADAGAFNVGLFMNISPPTDCSGEAQTSYAVSSLAAGASQTLTLDYWEGFGSAGDYAVNGLIDTYCTVSESNEGNNLKSVNMIVDDFSSIFSDDFETGDFSKWPASACVIDGGDLSVVNAVNYVGNYDMQARIDDNVAIYCASNHPTAETSYLARFSFDPNSISMVNGDTHLIFGGYSGTSTLVLRMQFRWYSGSYQLQASLLNDGSTWRAGSWIPIGDNYHEIQLYWKAASTSGANNGGLSLWIDETVREDLTGVDNDTRRIDFARLGAVNGIDTGTRGAYYFDQFISARGGVAPGSALLTVHKSGTGSGTVTSNPTGINCGSDCSETYPPGTIVSLTAASAAGSTFTGWSGGCSGTGTCAVTLNSDTSVSANFDLQSSNYTLTVNKTGTGSGTVTSSPAGISCGSDCSQSYVSGTVVTLNATAASGSNFTGWSGGCSGTGPCTMTMASSTLVTANFDLQTSSYTLSVNKTGTGSGTVTSNPAGINCGADCSEAYIANATVSLTATAAAGSNFTGWGGACSGTGACSVTMTANKSVTANFDVISSTDGIFSDGFESGSLSQWTSCTIDSGDLSVTTAAKYSGSYGMQALIDDNVSIYCTSDRPNAEPRYRARFYFDPNSIGMVNGDAHILLRGFSGTSTIVLRVEFGFSAVGYQIRAGLLNDGTAWTETGWFPLSDGPHFIELDWRAASAAGVNDGQLTLWIDGTQQGPSLMGIDNDTRRIDLVWLGAAAAIDTGTRGTYYFDAFESRRETYIGP